ncbi:PGF-CTERM-anchored ABC transporter substrate-binding protein [Halococcus sp. AFM35]|uniref:PGF-CTERM-anchored ABC transporter substrate-binding protein n=1 Tax=Halococcus sp. AFM35 TaxID=3421653 RepID=UPI003EB91E92
MLSKVASAAMVLLVVAAGIGPAAAAPAELGSHPAQTANCSFPVTATDATGTEVTVENEPQRVVALGASTAQTLWEVGAKEKVVGMPVNPTTAYLNGSANRTNIYRADGFTVATEQVVGLEPDLVLAPNIVPNETVETLRGAGLTVYKFGFGRSLADIYAKTNRTGELVGACEEAAETAADTRERVNTIRQAVEGADSPRVLYPMSGGFAAGNGTFIHAVMETAGGDNIAANAGIEGYKPISNETIAQRNPEWIITSNATAIPTGEPYASTTAIQRNQTVVVSSNLISQPGPRVVVPMTKIARNLHPEAMQEANLSNTTTAQPTAADGGNATATTTSEAGTTVATDGGASTDDTTAETAVDASGGATDGATGTDAGTTTSSGSGPGFGVLAAAIALLGAALLGRRT